MIELTFRGANVAEPSTGPVSELDVLRRQARKTWNWLEETVSDVSAERANWWPPGTANSIGTIYLHVVINTDVEINRLIFDREPLVESRWGGDIGQGVPYVRERFDRWVRHVAVDWERLREYGRAVHEAFLASLDELDRRTYGGARRHDPLGLGDVA
jgi:hypothetical protein